MRYILSIFLFLVSVALASQEVSLSEATAAADYYIGKYFPGGEWSISSHETYGRNFENSIYLFRLEPEGWILVAGDKGAQPVLGFNYTGDLGFPGNDNVDSKDSWIASYTDQVEDLFVHPAKSIDKGWDYMTIKSTKSTPATVSITPFILAEWNQGKGWNRYCPVDPDGPGGHAYAGCVAVAMAQAMSVFQVPDSGNSHYTYISDNYGSITANFAAAHYRWDLMSNDTSDNYNSRLLYHCAVSVDMNFGPDGSGASVGKIVRAYGAYFYMSGNTQFRRRSLFSDEVWNGMLLTELENGRPIIYSGDADDGNAGHAFNIDGVIDSKYFHINWGWGGSQNGFFLVDALKVGTRDYTKNQSAIMGIQPYYYPTDIVLTNKIVPEDDPPGTFIGKVKIVDEASDNSYDLHLITDSTYTGGEWVKDYYLKDDSLMTGITFTAGTLLKDTIWFSLSDSHSNALDVAIVLTFETTTESTGIDNWISQGSLKIFPNPAGDWISFSDESDQLITGIVIFNLSGQIVRSFVDPSKNSTLSMAGLQRGMYILEATYRDGSKARRKVIKN